MIDTFENVLSSKHTGHLAIGAAVYAALAIVGKWSGLAVLGQPVLVAAGVAGAGLSLAVDKALTSDG